MDHMIRPTPDGRGRTKDPGPERAMVNISLSEAAAVTMGTDSSHPGHIRPT
jgi:hypothetical protein